MKLHQTVTELCTSMPVTPVLRTFVHYLITVCSRLEAASDVISDRFVRLAVPDKCLKFRDPRLNRSPEIRPEAVGGGIVDCFFLTSINADRKRVVTSYPVQL